MPLYDPCWDAPIQWRHNDHDSVSNHQPGGSLLNCLFRRRWKKTSKLRFTGFCAGNSPGPVNSPHKGPVTWKMFPFDDVIMHYPHCMKITLPEIVNELHLFNKQFETLHGLMLNTRHLVYIDIRTHCLPCNAYQIFSFELPVTVCRFRTNLSVRLSRFNLLDSSMNVPFEHREL